MPQTYKHSLDSSACILKWWDMIIHFSRNPLKSNFVSIIFMQRIIILPLNINEEKRKVKTKMP